MAAEILSLTQTSVGSRSNSLERGGRSHWWRRCGTKARGFVYLDAQAKPIQQPEVLERLQKLAIPPAWKEVRISPSPRSRLKVIGLDAMGRPQYRYHPHFVEKQQKQKYDKLRRFGERLPCLRRLTNEHLQTPGLSREKTLAVMLRLINDLSFRVGSDKSVKTYRTFGITTLQNRHLTLVPPAVLQFNFIGKHHIRQKRLLVDADLTAVVAEIKALRGTRLFQYPAENDRPHPIKPHDINHYIKACMGDEFSAKDFRTWSGTLTAAVALAEIGAASSERECQRNIVRAVRQVADKLGNTPAV